MLSYLSNFCEQFYHATTVPICYMSLETNELGAFPKELGNLDIFRNSPSGFMQMHRNPDYFVSDSFSYYGYVKSETEPFLLVIGPIYSTPFSEFTLHNFMKEWAIAPEHRETIYEFLFNLPVISFNRFLQFTGFLYYIVNQKPIDIYQHFMLTSEKTKADISDLHSKQVYEAKENRTYHNTWHFEQKLSSYIRQGDVAELKKLLSSSASALSEGIVADNALRQRKNICITTVAIATRSAIKGGLDIEQAYQLADLYIQDIEHSLQIDYISNMEYNMLIDFCSRVSQNKIPQDMSPEIFECIQYIKQHINEPVQVGDIADHIGRSRSYISEKFKNELGFNLNAFIMRCKLEEARSLLVYSDKSLCEISTYLCFSSQSYFQNVFKKKYGVTPKKYREEHRTH